MPAGYSVTECALQALLSLPIYASAGQACHQVRRDGTCARMDVPVSLRCIKMQLYPRKPAVSYG